MNQVDALADPVLLKRLSAAIYASCGGEASFATILPGLFRQAFDEVIDTPRTGRLTINAVEKVEKDYLGTKIKILLRYFFKLPQGEKLDVKIDGFEVDVQNTIDRNWAIPGKSLGDVCLLMRANEDRAKCDVGLMVVRNHSLNLVHDRDGKRRISPGGLSKIHWLLKDCDYPRNSRSDLPDARRVEVPESQLGSNRIEKRFELLSGRQITRNRSQAVVRQQSSKRLLSQIGGAKDLLARKGIALLSGQKDRDLIAKLGLGAVGNDQFISHRPRSEIESDLLRTSGHID